MGIFFVYILKSSVCLAVFYLFYRLLLSRETFHRFNRVALLGILFLSCFLPLVEVTVEKQTEVHQTMMNLEQWLMLVDGVSPVSTSGGQEEGMTVTWIQVALLVYWAGILFFAIRSVCSLVKLLAMLRMGRKEDLGEYIDDKEKVTLIVHERDIAPFSWMKYIVISRKDLDENGWEILIHELAHIHNRHSWDLLVADICIFFQWFNPASWLLKQELQNIHEYEADETVIETGVDAKQYQLLLIKKAVGTRLYSMANGFDHSKLKNRIGMMLKKRSNGWVRLRILLAVPVAAGVVYAFAQPEMSEKQMLSQVEVVAQDALLQDTAAQSRMTEEIASMTKFFKEKSDAWWEHHRTPEGCYIWRTTQVHRIFINGNNEVLFDNDYRKRPFDVRRAVAERLRSAREADVRQNGKDEPHFLRLVYDVKSDKQLVLQMLKDIKSALDDLREEYVAKGVSDVDEVCPYMVSVFGPRKFGIDGTELLIGAVGNEPKERIYNISWKTLKHYQKKYGKNASVMFRADDSVGEESYAWMCKRIKQYFPNAKTNHVR